MVTCYVEECFKVASMFQCLKFGLCLGCISFVSLMQSLLELDDVRRAGEKKVISKKFLVSTQFFYVKMNDSHAVLLPYSYYV